jgi:glycolate oxidase iron-sulfur subunit
MAADNNSSVFSLLDKLETELDKCVRCGECRSVCPVYNELRLEKFTSRGRISLLDALIGQELQLSKPLAQALDNCIMCLACQDKCGSQVKIERIIPLARAMVSDKQGLHLIKKIIIKGLSLPEKAIKSAALLNPLAFKPLPEDSGLSRRFPLPYVDRNQYIPKLSWPGFRAESPDYFPASQENARVSFFTGCLANHAFAKQAQNLVNLLVTLGFGVEIPQGQVCCGAPMHINGEISTARHNGERNLHALGKRPHGQKIVVLCASCGFTLKNVYPELFADSEKSSQAKALADDVMDISEFLISQIETEALREIFSDPLNLDITYHDPCHLVRGQGVSEQPRQLLDLITKNGLTEMEKADQCCGSGGTYGLVHKNVSEKILKAKMTRAQETGADIIATACPACMIQLKSGARKFNTGQKVVHIVDLLAKAIEKNKKNGD